MADFRFVFGSAPTMAMPLVRVSVFHFSHFVSGLESIKKKISIVSYYFKFTHNGIFMLYRNAPHRLNMQIAYFGCATDTTPTVSMRLT